MVIQSAAIAEAESATGFSYAEEAVKRIAQLYGDSTFADVTFVVQHKDGPVRKFVGHRNIISCWSDPLDAMLCGSFAEGNSREVSIWDVEPDAFEAMLKMMYCGKVELTVDNVLAVLDASARFDVEPLVQFCVQFMQNHTSIEQACMMLEVGVQYGLVKLVDKCIELIVTDDHILESEEFNRLSQAAVIELAKHDSWNLHEDDIYEKMLSWAAANADSEEQQAELVSPILKHVRYLHMSVEKLKQLTNSELVPNNLIFEALFFKLKHAGPDDISQLPPPQRPRQGSRLFSWVPTSKVTVSGDFNENAMHTSANGFTGVRGDRRMQQGIYSWSVQIVETQSSWIFVGIAQADDPNDVAWRSTGRMLYCLDARYFHQGSGQNHPNGDRKIYSGDCIRVTLDCQSHTLAFGVNQEKPLILFQELPAVAYVPAVDLRDCGDKVRLVSDVKLRHSKSTGQKFDAKSHQVDATAAANESQVSHPADALFADQAGWRAGESRAAVGAQSSAQSSSTSNGRVAGRARVAARPAPPTTDGIGILRENSTGEQTLSGPSGPATTAGADLPTRLPLSGELQAALPTNQGSNRLLAGNDTNPAMPGLAHLDSSSEVQASHASAEPPARSTRSVLASELGATGLNALSAGAPAVAAAGISLPGGHSGSGVGSGVALERVRAILGSEGQIAAAASDLPAPGRSLSGGEAHAVLTNDSSARGRQPLTGSEVQAALTGTADMPMRSSWGSPFSGSEVHVALGLSHHGAGGSSYARMSQPRQSQGSLGSTSGAWAPSLDRGGQGISLLEPLSLLGDAQNFGESSP